MLLLLLLLATGASASVDPEGCSVTVARPGAETNATSARLRQLFEWCVADAACRGAYELDARRPSQAAFEHFLPMAVADMELEDLFYSAVCAHADGDAALDVARRLWLPTLIAHRTVSSPICDIDHVLAVDPATRVQSCQCRPDRPCRQKTINPTALYVVYALLVAIALAQLALAVSRNRTLNDNLSRAVGDQRAALRALFAAGKG